MKTETDIVDGRPVPQGVEHPANCVCMDCHGWARNGWSEVTTQAQQTQKVRHTGVTCTYWAQETLGHIYIQRTVERHRQSLVDGTVTEIESQTEVVEVARLNRAAGWTLQQAHGLCEIMQAHVNTLADVCELNEDWHNE